MEENNISEYREVIKDGGSTAYYAVAQGGTLGIKPVW
jgi:hypothetical protein